MEHHALDERHELSQALRAAGPDAPTLCGEWTTAVLAAHLVQRERSLVEAAGRLPVGSLRRRADEALHELAERTPYDQLVAAVDSGPPFYSPWALAPLREAVNLLEYVVHHEDVRRGVPGTGPRAMPIARQRAIWSRLRLSAPFTMRAVPVGVRLLWPGHGEILTRRAKHGFPVVTVGSEPVELALVAFGRQRVAQVDYDGSAADVATVSGAKIRI
ncbi:MAG: hypothetical protein QOK11_2376 [Pseudonocardiales bacterium]|nr:hypothetical protein [Pseudonocardiales bacterium]